MTAERKTTRKNGNASRACALIALLALLTLPSACGRKHRHSASNVPPAPRRTGAGSKPGESTQRQHEPPRAVAPGYVEEGMASWYGVPYHGRPAADGEIYDMETLVAAHRILPFNTWLRVTNLGTRQSVNVRVIDRGPFVNGRILDLSKAAARDIGLLGPGLGKIRLEVISAPPDRPANDFYTVQIGAFAVRANAERERSRLAARYGEAYIALRQGRTPLWRVLVGRKSSPEAAQDLAKLLLAENQAVFVVRLDEAVTSQAGAAGSGAPADPLAAGTPAR